MTFVKVAGQTPLVAEDMDSLRRCFERSALATSPLVFGLYKYPAGGEEAVKLLRWVGLFQGSLANEFDLSFPCDGSLRSLEDAYAFVENCRERTQLFLERLFLLLRMLGFRARLTDDHVGRMFARWWLLYISRRGEKVWKFTVSYLFAFSQGQELPVREPWQSDRFPAIGPGPLYVWSRSVACGGIKRAWSILNLKRLFPAVDDLFIRQALEKHKGICKTSYGPATYAESILEMEREEVIDLLSDQVLRTVEEAVSARDPQGLVPFLLPSCSGHFECGRKKGGASGWLKAGYNATSNDPSSIHSDVLIAMSEKGEELRFSERGIDAQPFSDWIDGLDDHFRCYPSVVAEPCKARVVTRGPAATYWKMRAVQKSFHSALRRHPVFRLIGEPCNSSIISERFSSPLEEDESYCSADYEAATDNLDPDLSEVATVALLGRLGIPWELHRTVVQCLTGHSIVYPGESTPRDQVRGQLMGSPISFPILCLVNAAVCRWAMELSSGVAVSLNRCPLLVNGDDAVFVIKNSGYSLWKYLVSMAGLKPSMGKNYLSNRFLTINTELYRPITGGLFEVGRSSLFGDQREFEYIPYLNSTLLLGFKARGQKSESCSAEYSGLEPKDLSQRAERLLRGFSHDDKKALLSVFIQKNDILRSLPKGMSWFLPHSLGGLGLPVLRPVRLSDEAVVVARVLSEGRASGDSLNSFFSATKHDGLDLQDFTRDVLRALGAKYGPMREGEEDGFGKICPYSYLMWTPRTQERTSRSNELERRWQRALSAGRGRDPPTGILDQKIFTQKLGFRFPVHWKRVHYLRPGWTHWSLTGARSSGIQ